MATIKKLLPFLCAPLKAEEPQYLIFFVTDVCNAKCAMCFNPPADSIAKEKELSLEEIEKVAKSMKHLIQLTISGGEPFLRDGPARDNKNFRKAQRCKICNIVN